jgi:hypothetical protein
MLKLLNTFVLLTEKKVVLLLVLSDNVLALLDICPKVLHPIKKIVLAGSDEGEFGLLSTELIKIALIGSLFDCGPDYCFALGRAAKFNSILYWIFHYFPQRMLCRDIEIESIWLPGLLNTTELPMAAIDPSS